MTAEEIISKSDGLLGLASKLMRALWIVAAAVIAVSVWVYATNANILDLRRDVDKIASKQLSDTADTAKWRSDTDKLLATIVAVQKAQSDIQAHQQYQLDNVRR